MCQLRAAGKAIRVKYGDGGGDLYGTHALALQCSRQNPHHGIPIRAFRGDQQVAVLAAAQSRKHARAVAVAAEGKPFAIGCWSANTAIYCIEVMEKINALPFWKRKKEWLKVKNIIETDVVAVINAKIQEMKGGAE